MSVIPKGQEPVNIKKRLDTLFKKLDEAYPNKCIARLNADHKKWGETVTELYRLLGYESSKDFLEAYGYTVVRPEVKGGGRPKTVDGQGIVVELQRRYPNGSEFKTVDELFAANPDLDPQKKSLANNSQELFGQGLSSYLKSLGLLKVSQTKQNQDNETNEKEKYQVYLEQYTKDLSAFLNGISIIPPSLSFLYLDEDMKRRGLTATKCVKHLYGKKKTLDEYLAEIGLLSQMSTGELFEQYIAELKKRYSDPKDRVEKIVDLIANNKDLHVRRVSQYIREKYKQDTEKFYIRNGILRGADTDLQQYTYCHILTDLSDDLLWYIAPFEVEVGEVVRVPLYCFNNVDGEIKEVVKCLGIDAPYPVQKTRTISGHIGEESPIAFERSCYVTQKVVPPEKKNERKFESGKNVDFSTFAKTKVRGLGYQMTELCNYIKKECGARAGYSFKEKISPTEIVDVYEADLTGIGDPFGESLVKKVIQTFPELKIVGFYESNSAYICYSEPGYPFVTHYKWVGGLDFKSDLRYTWENDPTTNFSDTVIYLSCGEREYIKYRFPYEKEWNKYNYLIKDGEYFQTIQKILDPNGIVWIIKNGACIEEHTEISIAKPMNSPRVKEYYNSKDDFKCFSCKYRNQILENAFEKYKYSSKLFEDPTNIDFLEDRIPDYKGVETIEELTATLISALISFGDADEGFEAELNARKNEIQGAFVFIEGTSQETMDFELGEDFLCDGFDFELVDGEYSASYRQCDGGW